MSKIAKPAIVVANVNGDGSGGGGGGGDGVKLALLSFSPDTIYALKTLISHEDTYGAFNVVVATTDSMSNLAPGSGEEGYAMLTLFSELAIQGEAASMQSFTVSVPTGRDLYAFVQCLSGNVSPSNKLSTALYDALSNELIQEVSHTHKSDNGSTILSVGPFSISEDLAGGSVSLSIYND